MPILRHYPHHPCQRYKAADICFIDLNSKFQGFLFYTSLPRFCSNWSVPLDMFTQRTWVTAGKVTMSAFVWFFSTVRFQMCPQMACPRGCIVTLVAFVWLFSTVRFQMCPQIPCLKGCIVTLAAFVWFLSTVGFQMCPQIACIRRCKFTLVAFVWLFSSMHFQMSPKLLAWEEAKSHWLH